MKVVDITLYVQYWKQIALNFGHWFLLFFFISLLNRNVKVMKVTRPILITQVVVLSCPDFCFRKCRVLLNYVR